MLKRLVVEASQQSWLLLVQPGKVYQAWRQEQKVQQQLLLNSVHLA
jgi:alpha-tubulin suppressor-like RCC1 family protein